MGALRFKVWELGLIFSPPNFATKKPASDADEVWQSPVNWWNQSHKLPRPKEIRLAAQKSQRGKRLGKKNADPIQDWTRNLSRNVLLENKGYIFFRKYLLLQGVALFLFVAWAFFPILSKSVKLFQRVQVAEVRRRPENRKNHLFIQAQVSTNPRACGNLAIDLSAARSASVWWKLDGGTCLLTKIWEIACSTCFLITLKSSMLGSNGKCILLTCYASLSWSHRCTWKNLVLYIKEKSAGKITPNLLDCSWSFQKNGQWPLFARVSHTVLLWHLYRRLAVSRSEAYNQYPQQTPHSCKQVARWGNMNVWFLCRTERL